LLATIGRWFRSDTLKEEERAYLAEVVRGAALAGPLVLAAKDRADFDDQMDRITRLPELYEAIEPTFCQIPSPHNAALSAFDTGQGAADRAALFIEALGPGAIRPLLRGFQYWLAVRQALEPLNRLLAEARPQVAEVLPSGPPVSHGFEFFRKSREQPLWFLTDPTMSVEVARSWRHVIDMCACLLVMAWVFLSSERPEPWLSLALAERWESDLYGILRLVASVPGFDVPDDLVPVSNRYDLQRAEADAERARLRADRLFAEAEHRGATVWPPLSEAEDG
jgi:hypothetical protein